MKKGLIIALLTLASATAGWAATSEWTGNLNSSFSNSANWSNGVPNDIAVFGPGSNTSISGVFLATGTSINIFRFDAGAPSYTISVVLGELDFVGPGITNNSGVAQNILLSGPGALQFYNNSTAGDAHFEARTGGSIAFKNASNAGASIITNNEGTTTWFYDNTSAANSTIRNFGTGFLVFTNASTAGDATIQNFGGITNFGGTSNADHANVAIEMNGYLRFGVASDAGESVIMNRGSRIEFFEDSSAGDATIVQSSGTVRSGMTFHENTNAGTASIISNGVSEVIFLDSASARSANFENYRSHVFFNNDTTAEQATFSNFASGSANFFDSATADQSTIINTSTGIGAAGGRTWFHDSATAGRATIINSSGTSLNLSATIFDGNSNAGTANITNSGSHGYTFFTNTSSASDAVITSLTGATLQFTDTSSAGNATITNAGGLAGAVFYDFATAENAVFINSNSGSVAFLNNSHAAQSTIINMDHGAAAFYGTSAENATIANNAGGRTVFTESSVGGNATITNYTDGSTAFYGSATAGTVNILNNGGTVSLNENATAGHANIVQSSGAVQFNDRSTAGNAMISAVTGSASEFSGESNAGSAGIANNGGITNFYDITTASNSVINNFSGGKVNFSTASSAGNATISNGANGSANFFDVANAGSSRITNSDGSSIIQFNNASNAGNATLTNNGAGLIQFNNTALGGNSAIVNNGGTFSINTVVSPSFTVGSLAGSGSFLLGSHTLNVGNDGTDTAVSGVISGVGASIVKVGTGTLSLSGINTYSGNTSVLDGVLAINNNNNLGNGNLILGDGTLKTNAGITSNRSVTLLGDGVFDTNGFDSFWTGNIHGSGDLAKTGNGTLVLSGNNDYAGTTIIDQGTLMLGSANALPDESAVFLGNALGTRLDLNNFNQTIGSLAGGGDLGGDVVLGNATLTLGGDNTSTSYDGSIQGLGNLVKIGTGTLTLSGQNIFTGTTTVDAGMLNLTGSLRGDAIIKSSATFSNTGTMGGLINQGVVTPGVNGVGRLTVDRYSGSGTLRFLFDGKSFNDLVVNTTATLTGGTLNIDGPNTSFETGRYSVITATSVAGAFSAVDAPGRSYFLTIDTEYTPTEVNVIVHALDFVDAAHNNNHRAMAPAMDAGRNQATGGFASAIGMIYALPNEAEVTHAFDQASGDSLASFQSAGIKGAEVFTNQMTARATPVGFAKASEVIAPVQLAYSGLLSSSLGISNARANNEPLSGYGLWTRGVGFLDFADGDSSIGSPASKASTGGFQVGYDFLVKEDVLFGLSAGYADTSLSVDDRSSSGNSESVQSGIYASYFPSAWFFNGSLAYTTSSNKMTRTFGFSGMDAQSDFQSRSHTAFVEAGYRYEPNERTVLEPSLSLRQNRYKQEAFTESGNSGLNLSVSDQKVYSLVSGLGVRLRRLFAAQAKHPFAAGIRTIWQHELADTHNSITSQFAGAGNSPAFTVQGTPRSRDAMSLGLEGRVQLGKNLQAFGDYSLTLGSNQETHGILGGVSVQW